MVNSLDLYDKRISRAVIKLSAGKMYEFISLYVYADSYQTVCQLADAALFSKAIF